MTYERVINKKITIPQNFIDYYQEIEEYSLREKVFLISRGYIFNNLNTDLTSTYGERPEYSEANDFVKEHYLIALEFLIRDYYKNNEESTYEKILREYELRPGASSFNEYLGNLRFEYERMHGPGRCRQLVEKLYLISERGDLTVSEKIHTGNRKHINAENFNRDHFNCSLYMTIKDHIKNDYNMGSFDEFVSYWYENHIVRKKG